MIFHSDLSLPDVAGAHAGADRSAGLPLGPEVRARAEDYFGRSFADVRLHTDEHAARAARALDAHAFVRGRDLYFTERAYQPGTREGQRRLAHALAHAHQPVAPVRPTVVAPARGVSEAWAERAAWGFVAGRDKVAGVAPSRRGLTLDRDAIRHEIRRAIADSDNAAIVAIAGNSEKIGDRTR